MKKIYFLAISLLMCASVQLTYGQSTTFNYTGSVQSYTVPTGVTMLGVDARGAGGGPAYNCCTAQPSAPGGRVQCTLAVTPGAVYYIYVGGAGANWSSSINPTGGFNGGAGGGSFAAPGGGASDVRTSASGTAYTGRLVVAGGAGGGGDFNYAGGAGGGTTGGTGTLGACGGGATGPSCTTGYTLGTFGAGGFGNIYSCGGGGGGWYGGNCGVYLDGGGGGGSSYTDPTLCTSVTHTQGYASATGNGQVILTVLCNSPGTISGPTNLCVGSTSTLTDPTSITGGTWSSSNTSVATINSSTGVITALTPGTTTITYTITNPCGSLATAVVTVNPLPAAITGSTTVCIGSTATLSDATAGGTWTSSNTGQATIGSTTGLVTGISAGFPNMTYTLPTGCSANYQMTVNSSAAAISGLTNVCPGSTVTLTDPTGPGTWTSSNPAFATVGSASGVVTGVSGGFPSITYTSPSGCTATTVVQVYNMSPIVGVLGMCSLGTTTTLTDATAGGTWSSSNTGVATIGSSTGVLTSVGYGSATISYTVASTGCVATAVEGISSTSGGTFSMTGGGSYCTGGAGVAIGLSGSTSGVSYQLFSGTGPAMPAISGAGFPINFGLVPAGTYYVVADFGSSCAQTMTGTAVVATNPLPTPYTVSGGGAFCAGTGGVHIYLNASTIGINYQLMLGVTPVGSPIAGTSSVLDFGLQTAAGTYSVVGTNAATGCVNNMSNTVTVSVSPLPSIYLMTPGTAGFCSGGTGVTVGLSGSTTGTSYTLYYNGVATSTVVSGTGSAINFGLQTGAGTYTAIATSTTTGCVSSMVGTSVVSVNAYPTVFTVTGGGAYCSGGSGVHIGLNASTIGVNYQLYNGVTAVGTPYPGSGAALDFGLLTAAGSYTVVAVNGSTGCSVNMSGSALITISPLPAVFTVTGGGGYCAGGTGLPVGLSGSVSGTNYSLYNASSLSGGASGTGAALSFGSETAAGTYTVIATNTVTGCANNMAGSATITINPLPTVFSVGGGGPYCAGGTGVHVTLSGSTSGVNYQAFVGGSTSGTVAAGTGSSLDFGLKTTAGAYTVVATNASTGCTSIMSGSASVSINPLPVVYNVTGGASYCTGGTGSVIGLNGSNTGISYQLYNGTGLMGSALSGTGTSLNFGLQTLTGTYTIVGTNTTTGCQVNMAGSPTISLLPLPTVFTVSGSASSYCAGGAGVHVLLSNSTSGVNYQLYYGTTAIGSVAAGSGFPLDFGAQTAAGTYYVVATNAVTGCTSNMAGSAVITINPLPTAYAVTGGGGYCAGGTGVHIGTIASSTGISYQLYNGLATVGSPILGTGAALDFGAQTAAGTYTVQATNSVTGCTLQMTGSATVTINPLPVLHTLTGGGNYCFGTSGSDIGLNGSETGNNYQLFVSGATAGAPLAGTGSSLDFGIQSTTGTYTIVATNATTGCTTNMTGSSIVGVNPLPVLHAVTGGGNYCPGGAGVHVGLNASDAGISYQLYKGTTPVGTPVAGTGLVIDFGLQTATGVYTVVAKNNLTSCTNTMTGSVTVGISALPVVYNVTGGGNFCPGGAGVHIGLSGSAIGVNYQLFIGGSPVGSAVAGTGLPLDFGSVTGTGAYTVVATSAITTCSINMNGTVNVGISPLPGVHVVTGGGNYCTGGAGSDIGLDGSDLGISYQLYVGTSPSGAPVTGTGSAIDFGMRTATGTYTVIGLSAATTCTNGMTGSVNIGLNPLPVAFNIAGGGSYCAGGAGMDITLSGSVTGVHYQLFNGTSPVGPAVAGTGSVLDFGSQTLTGSYTVAATDATTGCSSNMTGTATIGINALPIAYAVTGGGNICAGGSGVHIVLTGSNTGVSYQLINGGVLVGTAMPGTGFSIDFGAQTGVGSYTVVATNNTTSCTNNMTGSATISASPLPAVYAVSSTSSNYCIGGAGVDISLTGSSAGVNYQLYHAGSPVGSPVAGTGSAINFGYNTLPGTYTVVATNTATTCTNNMASSVTVVIDPLPVSFTVTGGGNYCTGGAGVAVGLSGSNTGILYQLYNGTTPAGTPVAGTGGPVSFGMQTVTGSYHVVATNPGTTCTNNMSGAVNVGLNALPVPFSVSAGGNFCAGGSGIDVTLSSSNTGVNYQLFNGTSPVGSLVAGTGGMLDFGMQTTAGNYTVIATNGTTTCANNMAGVAAVVINPLPAPFAVTGGGNYCQGGTGVLVGLANSAYGVSYQLFNGSTPVGSAVTGSGAAISFGAQTGAGSYTVVASDLFTTCGNHMSGTVTVGINALPTIFNVTGGGAFCASGTGVHVTLNGSQNGVNYQLYNGLTPSGAVLPGNGGILDFGPQNVAGTYTVYATNATTTCGRAMAGSAMVSVTPLITPAVSINTTAGDTLCSGNFTTFTAAPVNGGTSPTYRWTINGVVLTATGSSYAYIPVNGDVLAVVLTTSETCVTHTTATASKTMDVLDEGTPAVNISAAPGNVVCATTPVTFTASPSFGGSAPVYSWFKGTANVGSGASFTYTPLNGDVVYCVLSSNYHCRTTNNATSAQITMEVDNPQTPVVTITTNPSGRIAAGVTVTFTANYSNAGATPTFQWMVNGVAVPGANSSTFVTNAINNADVVSCQVTSSGGCAGIAGSGTLTVQEYGVGVQPVVAGTSDVVVVPNPNKGMFTIKGNLGTASDEEVNIEVINMIGQVIYSSKIMSHNGEINEKVQLTNAANGMYILNMRSGADNKVFHLVIEQ